MSSYCCPKRCPDRETMQREHGTPETFRAAVLRAVPAFASLAEAEAAYARYATTYARAPERIASGPAETVTAPIVEWDDNDPALIEPPRRQEKIAAWVRHVFEGDAVAVAGPERTFRFVEEAVELAQAVGIPPDGLKRLVDYVYERPAGEPRQEVGGCFVTLYAACQALGIDGDLEADMEIARIQDPAIVERVRGRQAEKRKLLEEPQSLAEWVTKGLEEFQREDAKLRGKE